MKYEQTKVPIEVIRILLELGKKISLVNLDKILVTSTRILIHSYFTRHLFNPTKLFFSCDYIIIGSTCHSRRIFSRSLRISSPTENLLYVRLRGKVHTLKQTLQWNEVWEWLSRRTKIRPGQVARLIPRCSLVLEPPGRHRTSYSHLSCY